MFSFDNIQMIWARVQWLACMGSYQAQVVQLDEGFKKEINVG